MLFFFFFSTRKRRRFFVPPISNSHFRLGCSWSGRSTSAIFFDRTKHQRPRRVRVPLITTTHVLGRSVQSLIGVSNGSAPASHSFNHPTRFRQALLAVLCCAPPIPSRLSPSPLHLASIAPPCPSSSLVVQPQQPFVWSLLNTGFPMPIDRCPRCLKSNPNSHTHLIQPYLLLSNYYYYTVPCHRVRQLPHRRPAR